MAVAYHTEDSGVQTDVAGWAEEAVVDLLSLQSPDGGWGYAAGAASATEPTALAALALTAMAPETDALSPATQWLLARQRDDGMFVASVLLNEASWVTPLAALALAAQGQSAASQAAADALLALPVLTFDPHVLRGVYGFDTSIPGWPWTPGDFSFVEPTAMAVVFLKRAGRGQQPRVRRGVDLLLDRALPEGGWNYGEPQVLGGDLYPAAAPTALALLALADEQDEHPAAAVSWLLGEQGQMGALFSLGWASIALSVLGLRDDAWGTNLVARWHDVPEDRRGPLETSLCLLGLADADGHPLSVF
jgi:squalene cyclase